MDEPSKAHFHDIALDTEAVAFIRSKSPHLLRRKGLGSDWFGLGKVGSSSALNASDSFVTRDAFIHAFGFAILDHGTVTELVKFSPLLEIGSGSGYWAWELKKAGADIVATDIEPTDENRYRFTKFWMPVEKLDGVTAVKRYPGRTLLMVWPDYDVSWSYEVLRAYKGERVIYVGEGDGGCTACDQFHEHLNKYFEREHDYELFQFFGIHDRVEVWERRSVPLPPGFRKMRVQKTL